MEKRGEADSEEEMEEDELLPDVNILPDDEVDDMEQGDGEIIIGDIVINLVDFGSCGTVEALNLYPTLLLFGAKPGFEFSLKFVTVFLAFF